jgi:hypothetical protein
MAGLIEIRTDPSRREVRVFGLLWLAFFAGVGAVALWRPAGLVGASLILGAAWLASLIFNREHRTRQLAGALLPLLFGATGAAASSGLPARSVLFPLAAIGVGGALAIWAAPGIGKRIWVGWMTAAAPIGWSLSHVVLAAVYYLVLTPIGLVMRAAGRDPLARRFDRAAASYWIKRDPQVSTERYFRQF